MQLTFHDISKSYGTNLALQHFSATMEPGIYALLGPNGSGKSTLMNILTDNLRADTGHITFEAEGLEAQDVKKLGVRFRERVGYMPQYPGMYPTFTVEEFLWYVAVLKDVGAKLKRAERRKYVWDEISKLLDAVELSDV
ncbi:MAG: ATP-binding cassette domain-containing protein, partial [Clostridia bacterium]|nr:ATP-binding cassette domain-containing protein [Clostridia bacterium]